MNNWNLSIGLYPGILFGIRTYREKEYVQHVLYVPFLDLCLEIEQKTEDDNGAI